MCDKELLVSYVYDELEGAERKAFQQHLASCLLCREEAQSLRATRASLVAWAPPERELGFTVPADRRLARHARIAAWPLAAAAALVLAVGSAVANLELRVVDGGVVIRAGSSQAFSQPAAAPADAEARQAIAALQQRVRDLEGSMAAQAARDVAPATVSTAAAVPERARIDGDELLRRVRLMIDESEGRQQQQFAVRLMQVVREMQAEHTIDLVRLEQTLNQHQAASNDEIFRQREEMKQYLRLVNQQR